MQHRKFSTATLSAFALTALLAGCGGSSSVPGIVPSPISKPQPPTIVGPTPPPGTSSDARGTLTLTIPRRATAASAHTRNPQWVSASTDHAVAEISTVGADGTTLTYYSSTTLAVNSTYCTTVSGVQNCSWTVAAPVGKDNAFVDLYDAANNLLATNRFDGHNPFASYLAGTSPQAVQTQFTMYAGTVNNVTLGTRGLFPVVTSVTGTVGCTIGTIAPTSTLPSCSTANLAVSKGGQFVVQPTLLDADGNAIVADSSTSSVLYEPVLITLVDPNGIISSTSGQVPTSITEVDKTGIIGGAYGGSTFGSQIMPTYNGRSGTATFAFDCGSCLATSTVAFTPTAAPLTVSDFNTSTNLASGATVSLGNTNPNTDLLTVSESGYFGAYTESDNCNGIVSVVARAPQSNSGSSLRGYDLTRLGPGSCTITFSAQGQNSLINVVSTDPASIVIHGKRSA